MRAKNLASGGQSGMSLIEVLVSLLIFSFAFLGLISLQARAVQVSTDAEDRGRAALLANEIVSTMWMQKALTVTPAALAQWQNRVANQAASGLPSSSGNVSTPDADGVVTVTVAWQAPSKIATAQQSRYVTQVMMP